MRVTHWLIARSIFVLSVTGLYIGRPFMTVPGAAGQSFVMGWMRVIHSYAAIVFMCAVIARVIWMFTGNKYARWDKFLAVHRARAQSGMLPTVLFYSFLRDKPPAYVGHNPVAGSAYLLVFGLYFLAIGDRAGHVGAERRSRLAACGGSRRWRRSSAVFRCARWIHHIVMWLLLGFTVHHVYSAILVAAVEKNGTIDSIVSGYKWVPQTRSRAGALPLGAPRRAR